MLLIKVPEKIKERDSHISTSFLQMSKGMVNHVEDSIVHSKLQGVEFVFDLYSQ